MEGTEKKKRGKGEWKELDCILICVFKDILADF
jgi:hypothetical protein